MMVEINLLVIVSREKCFFQYRPFDLLQSKNELN